MTEPAFHQLVPEEPGVVPTVRVDAVWDALVAAIEASPAKDRLFARYVEKEVFDDNQHGARLRVQETAVAIMNICLRNRLFTPRINSRAGFYKVPAGAFVPRFDSGHGIANADATTWSIGVLHRLDTTEPFEWIAAGGYALLVTEDEAAVVREQAREIFGREERDGMREARQHILDRASRGELSAKEAEAEAMRQGLEELAFRPPKDRFDPRHKAAWTLAMTLAWIAWRSFDEVREWDPDYRQECREWTASDDHPNGRRLKPRDPPTVWEFECWGSLRWSERERGQTDRAPDRDLPRRTLDELWRALQEGLPIADGVPAGGGPRRDIEAREWKDLEPYLDQRTGREHLRYRHEPRRAPAYSEVTLSRAQVIAVWPERTLSRGEDDSDEAVVATIRRLMAERGGRLPQNDGARFVREAHPSRRRDEIREMIKDQTGNRKPGPSGPRS